MAGLILCPQCGLELGSTPRPCPACSPVASAHGEEQGGGSSPAAPESSGGEELDLVPAGFWLRFAALGIDTALVTLHWGVLIGVGVLALGEDTVRGLGWSGRFTADKPDRLLSLMVLLYFPVLEASALRGTLGKLICGIVVVDRSLDQLSFGRALLRNLAKIISGLPFSIGFLMAAFGTRRALHDRLTGTQVLRRSDRGGGWILLMLLVSFVLMAGVSGVMYLLEIRLGASQVREETPIVTPFEPDPAPVATSTPKPSPTPTAAPTPQPGSARVGSTSLSFADAFARYDRVAGTIEIAFFRFLLSPEQVVELRAATSLSEGGSALPDVTVRFQLLSGGTTCARERLRSYVVAFHRREEGFPIPGTRPTIEFARARSDGSRAEIPIFSCQLREGGTLAAVLQSGGSVSGPGGPVEFEWELVASLPLAVR